MNDSEAALRILVVTQYFWPENFRINDLVLGLRDRGHAVTVLTGKPNYPGGRLFAGYRPFGGSRDSYQGIPVLRVPVIPRGSGSGFRLLLNYLSFAVTASLLGPLFCRGCYDAVFVWETSPVTVGIPGLVMKKLKGAPMFFWVQDLWPESLSATGAVSSRWILKGVEWLVRTIYRWSDVILVQSRAFAASVEKYGGRSERIRYFPNSAEEFYRPVAMAPGAPERARLPAGFRLMFAGNIGAAQDFETILAAAESLKGYPDIHWLVLGDGRRRSWVERQVEARGLTATVHLLGRHPVEAMPRYFALADVLLVTLKKAPIFALTIPSKVQSYLACARPVVAALEGEGARVVEEAGAGLVCSPEEPAALADRVLAMYRMPEAERRAMGEAGRRYFQRHFERRMLIDRLDGWLREAATRGDRVSLSGKFRPVNVMNEGGS
jgi:glycosyltransferase involved in cell wall biosynthesis